MVNLKALAYLLLSKYKKKSCFGLRFFNDLFRKSDWCFNLIARVFLTCVMGGSAPAWGKATMFDTIWDFRDNLEIRDRVLEVCK